MGKRAERTLSTCARAMGDTCNDIAEDADAIWWQYIPATLSSQADFALGEMQ
jgi:hypothetical protein